jgi:Protein of unknown function (DUF2877)
VSERTGCAASAALAPLVDGPPRPLVVAHCSSTVWQLADASGRVVACLLSPRSLRLPHGIVVSSPLPDTRALPDGRPAPVELGAGRLRIGDDGHRVARWWRPAEPRHTDLYDGIDETAATVVLRTWRSRLGAGDGLTPYADDVICGALVTLLATGHPAGAELAAAVDAADLEGATTATSAGLLRQAVHGRCIDALAGYLDSLTSDEAARERGLARLEEVGHSSGRGMAEGVHEVLPGARPVRRSPDTTVAAA